MKRLQPYMSHADDRGSLTGITQASWQEINYVQTGPSQRRGDHYHEHTHELFYIIEGRMQIEIDDIKSGQQQRFEAHPGDIFIIEPFERHRFYTLTECRWINALSQAMDPERPDIHQ